ncbi:hypothetical protein A6V39_05185 [Candidatus Mycoplasma haematobovis]|uniref:Uncharacterized protein n=1 Tax=Candidatus Mycoplasma haematobovis TaxID=432608 RepID=A0A1A9QB75_9MOLU|nr:hypothetical protein [Candidatus Mycoplasma haematobovis]OAL09822.1 hypothetical protein A6V39_05185 [Candidatus Mycoplasma haematobovis]
MHIFAKAGLGVGAVAGIGGAGYGIYNVMQPAPKAPEKINIVKIRNTFGEAIINFSTENTLVSEKLKKLKEDSSDPKHTKLKEAKRKEIAKPNDGLEDFRNACQEIYYSGFTNKSSDTFKDFQSFCARTIKDKITKESWATDRANWKGRFDKLNKKEINPSSQELQQIASKTSQNGNELRDWCTKVADLVFEGSENASFRDAQASCGKND